MSKRFPFPHPVNETSARLVAAGVVVMGTAYSVTGAAWLLVPLVYGFLARVSTGPAFSPLALLVTRVGGPRLGGPARPVPGPPKRFAQTIGLTCSVVAVAAEILALDGLATGVIGLLVVAAALEAGLGLCLGCVIFGWLQRGGVIPTS
ncbi:MAG: DUF4395 domain-containing protein, partial [Ilumatobacteraceae bacterium]